MATDRLAALLQDRKAKQAGRLYKHLVCLNSDLVTDLADLRDERASLTVADEENRYGAAPADTSKVDAAIAKVEQQMAADTVQVVFRSLTYARYQTLVEDCQRVVERNGENVTELDMGKFYPTLAAECFVEFRQHGKTVDALGAAEFATLLETLPHGEADSLYFQLRTLHLGDTELPKSVRRSAQSRG